MSKFTTIPDGWTWKTIRDLCPRFDPLVAFEPNDLVWSLSLDQIVPSTGEIINRQLVPFRDVGTSTFVFDEDTVLYSKLRPYLNKVVRAKEPGVATTELVPLKPQHDVMLAGYLVYFLRSEYFLSFARQCVAGAKMPRLVMDDFWQFSIPHPTDLREQARIVEILDQADALRRKRAEADAKLANLLPALFRHHFGDPFTNPEKLQEKKLDDVIIESRYGLSLSASSERRGIPLLRMNNITVAGDLDLHDLKYVELSEGEIVDKRLRNGEILFNRTNSAELVGKTGLWESDEIAVAASYLIVVRVDPEQARPAYVWAWMNTPYFKQVLKNRGRRAIGMANINSTELRSFPILLPPPTDQDCFIGQLHALAPIRAKATASAAKLETLFQTLLHRAFDGSLTAKWREAHLKEHVQEMSRVTSS